VLDVHTGREHPLGADIVIVFLARQRGGELRPGDDAAAVGFFGPDELPELAFEATRLSLAAWRARLAGL
jgi:ADP-ribose pyrophosphatase YjhB (NUDIX family)